MSMTISQKLASMLKSDSALQSKDKLPNFKDTDDPKGDELAEKQAEKIYHKQVSTWVKTKYLKAKQDHVAIHNQWYLNMEFFKGNQYCSISRSGRIIKAPSVPGRVRMVINRIRPTVRTEISRMTTQKPIAAVVPASAEDEDIIAAEAAESLWEYVSQTKGFDDAMDDSAFWTSICGVGYVRNYWDESAPTTDKTESENLDLKGDFDFSAPTPFHILVPDLMEKKLQRQPFVFHVYTMSIEEVKARFGDQLDPEKEPTTVSTNEIFETRHLNHVSSEQSAKPDSCLVIETWIKPGATNLFPDGGMVILVDDSVVYCSKEFPFSHGEYPYVKIDGVPSGAYYGSSVIEDLIMLQKEINRNRSQIIEARNASTKAGYFVQEGSVDPDKWTSKPGQLIPIKPGFTPPTPIQIPPLPGFVDKDHENLLRDFEDLSGQHQVSKGSAPSGVTAATAINFLQERDDSYMAPVYKSIERATENAARQVLQLVVQYWSVPRLIKAVGLDQTFSTQFLTGADIKNGTDIRIQVGTSMPTSKAAMRAFITDLMNRGFVPPDKGLEMLDLPNMRAYYQLVKVDENAAKRENMKLANTDPQEITAARENATQQKEMYLDSIGQDEEMARANPSLAQALDQFDAPMLPVNDWDNDKVHIFMHENFMKSQRFEGLDPVIQDEFVRHVQSHKDKDMMKSLAQMMQGGVAGDPMATMGGEMGGPEMGGGTDPMQGMPPVDAGQPA
ncbi:portal protein [Arthrobacter phage GurgleFerb]|uniref:Portal protein n=4 Tax=Jasminevirus adat TaxID=2560299 RepID=A0A249XN57_9CAUD|nr:portal protein [Arthrobacter phage GurgleFerb]